MMPITVAAVPVTVPTVYAISPVPRRLTFVGRGVAVITGAACLTLLILAATLDPSPDGVGTHQPLGLGKCQTLVITNLPCPSCGMTTSFAWFVRGNFLASFYVQPMGFLLAALSAMTVWACGYMVVTGKPAYLLLGYIPVRYTLLPAMIFGVLAWGWKIFIHLRGIDGWG